MNADLLILTGELSNQPRQHGERAGFSRRLPVKAERHREIVKLRPSHSFAIMKRAPTCNATKLFSRILFQNDFAMAFAAARYAWRLGIDLRPPRPTLTSRMAIAREELGAFHALLR
jgi:hypothetical protein